MSTARKLLLICTGLILSPAAAQASDAPPGWEALQGAAIAEHVAELASDRYLGRGPASEGESRTLDYLQARLREYGVQPGYGDTYLQAVPLLESTPTRASALALGRTRLEFGKQFTALSFTAGGDASLDRSDVVFGGYGIVAPEESWDDYASVDLRGKTVLLLAGEPGAPGDDSLFEGRALTVHGMRDNKIARAVERGARAVFFVHTEAGFGYAWGAIESGARVPRSALADGSDPRTRLRMTGAISEPAARQALSTVKIDFDALVRRAGDRGFRAETLALKADVRLQSRLRESTTHNVVGILRGSAAANEAVIYTAHWDHLGHNPALTGGDTIFNGAVDNATGTAVWLDIARTFASQAERTRRSIVFIATGAEEQGLLGAEYHAGHPLFPLADTVAVINMDALFPFGRTASMTVTGMGSNELESLLRSAAARVGRSLLADTSPEFGAYFRSDHYPFVKRGVPGLFAVGGLTLEQAEAGGALLEPWAEYMTRYHQPNDEYDPATWDMAGIEQDARTFYEIGYRLAQSERWPNWHWDHALRAVRDSQRSR
ncbi:MAG: M28 family peptidase [Xanthomonadales bacterium]|nr:M28 family peptidase [Xanthomonadales bacterium]